MSDEGGGGVLHKASNGMNGWMHRQTVIDCVCVWVITVCDELSLLRLGLNFPRKRYIDTEIRVEWHLTLLHVSLLIRDICMRNASFFFFSHSGLMAFFCGFRLQSLRDISWRG